MKNNTVAAGHEVSFGEKAAVEFGADVILRRGECACGWRGCWYAAEAALNRSVDRHTGAR